MVERILVVGNIGDLASQKSRDVPNSVLYSNPSTNLGIIDLVGYFNDTSKEAQILAEQLELLKNHHQNSTDNFCFGNYYLNYKPY